MESLWVYEEFGEFLVIKTETNPPRQNSLTKSPFLPLPNALKILFAASSSLLTELSNTNYIQLLKDSYLSYVSPRFITQSLKKDISTIWVSNPL